MVISATAGVPVLPFVEVSIWSYLNCSLASAPTLVVRLPVIRSNTIFVAATLPPPPPPVNCSVVDSSLSSSSSRVIENALSPPLSIVFRRNFLPGLILASAAAIALPCTGFVPSCVSVSSTSTAGILICTRPDLFGVNMAVSVPRIYSTSLMPPVSPNVRQFVGFDHSVSFSGVLPTYCLLCHSVNTNAVTIRPLIRSFFGTSSHAPMKSKNVVKCLAVAL